MDATLGTFQACWSSRLAGKSRKFWLGPSFLEMIHLTSWTQGWTSARQIIRFGSVEIRSHLNTSTLPLPYPSVADPIQHKQRN
jgi:hypothetical protein